MRRRKKLSGSTQRLRTSLAVMSLGSCMSRHLQSGKGVLTKNHRLSLLNPILGQIACAIGTTPKWLRTHRRHQQVSDDRHLACWLLRQDDMPWPCLSYPLIAALLGMKNHTSAMSGARKVEKITSLKERAQVIVSETLERSP